MSAVEVIPDPLVPAEVDLRDFPFTPMYRARLFGSMFHANATDAEWRAGVTLWLKSWDQVPAGTLPQDDVALARLAELGRDLVAWRAIKARALHGWFLCSDQRLHHRVVAEGVLEAWARKRSKKGAALLGAVTRWGEKAAKDREAKKTRAERLTAAREKGTHSKLEWELLLAFCGPKCLRCGAEGLRLFKDHITPLYQGGSDGIENIQPLCPSCSSKKGSETIDYRPDGWRESLPKACQKPAESLPKPANRQGQGQGQGKKKETPDPTGSAPGGAQVGGQKFPSLDDKTWLFNEGLSYLAESSGKQPNQLRALLGRWSKAAGDNHAQLRRIVEDCAQAEKADPVSWITKAIEARSKPAAQAGGMTDEGWRVMVGGYKKTRIWPLSRGAKPDERHNQVPKAILEEFGYDPANGV